MRKKALRKDFYMEIRRTLNRFLSLLLITALGVAFFSGVRASKPDMQLSADAFYDESKLMDLRILGTLGLTEEDLEAVRSLEGVEEVMGSYAVDMFGFLEEERLNLQILSCPQEMNLLKVHEGRLPEREGECLVDEKLISGGRCKIGDRLTLRSATDMETGEILKEESFQVVGAGSSPYYMSLERGNTSIGNGTLDGFLVIPKESFSMNYYTQLCVTAQGARELRCYTQEYDDLADALVEEIEAISDERCQLRYLEVQKEAREKIGEAEEEVADGERKLSDAKKELEDARGKLTDAKAELADGEKELADGERELSQKEQELLDAKKEVADGWAELLKAQDKLVRATIDIEKGYQQYQEKKAELEAGYQALRPYEEQLQTLEGTLLQLQEGEEGLRQALLQLEAAQDPSLEPQKAALTAQLAALGQQREECEAGLGQLRPAVEKMQAELSQGQAALQEGKAALDEGNAQVEAGNREAYQAELKLKEAEEEIAEGEKKLADGRKELAEGRRELIEAQKKVEDAEKELLDGEAEYEKARLENEEKLADGKKKIADAKEELADLEVPEWFVLDRQYIPTYVDYGQNADRIGAIGEVFPVIFFLVAALVCLTTMTRMVEEERTQIGTLKALGYGRGAIASKYLLYALLSSLLGSLLGLVTGQKLLPTVIISAYKILYTDLPDILTPLNLEYSLTATAAAVFCTTAAALAACYKELYSVPAKLMRPAAPKAGKRVFLERLPFLWKRLNFSRKAAVRNLIRYKKRFFMTIFGIGGCMALLLVGFGLKDSILYIGKGQFGAVFTYDASIVLDTEASQEEKEELLSMVEGEGRITHAMELLETALTAEAGGVEKSAYLIVPKDSRDLSYYIHLQDRASGEAYELPKEGIVVSEKLASLLKLSEGDRLILKEDDTSRAEAVVAHITENYFMHYIYMDASYYEELFEKELSWNALFTRNGSVEEEFEKQLQADLMENPAVSAVTFTSGTAQRVADMLKSMDLIIYVLVIAAGLLAFVVLYNLNNITINERKRELATLKVLGFFDREISAYVNRENVILTFLGAAAGVFLGIFLHRFVIVTAETDTLMFGRVITGKSYLYSLILTFVFSAAVNGAMYVKLRRIDMVESLKSVE